MAYTSPDTLNMTTGIGNLFPYLNEVTYNWFGRLLMIALYLLIFAGIFKKREDFSGTFAITSFVCFVLGLPLWLLGLLDGVGLSFIIGAVAISTAILLIADKRGN